jgi:hypothetical protein
MPYFIGKTAAFTLIIKSTWVNSDRGLGLKGYIVNDLQVDKNLHLLHPLIGHVGV